MKPPKKISVMMVEVGNTEVGDLVVLNTDRGFLRAAIIKRNPDTFVCWLGRACLGSDIPRRHLQNYAYDVLGLWH